MAKYNACAPQCMDCQWNFVSWYMQNQRIWI